MQQVPHPSFDNYRTHMEPRHQAKGFCKHLSGRFYANNGLDQVTYQQRLVADRQKKYAARAQAVSFKVQRDLEHIAELELKVRGRQQQEVWAAIVVTSTVIVQVWWRGCAARCVHGSVDNQ